MNRANPIWLVAAMIWIVGAAAVHAEPAAGPEEADAKVLALLKAYEVGSTTYQTFSQDFDLSGEAITQSRIGERKSPTSGRIGIIEWKDRAPNLAFKGPDAGNLAAEIMAARDSGEISPEINQYMLGTFIFGYQNDQSDKALYSLTPERFTVVARIRFLDGILVEKTIAAEPGSQP